MCDSRSPGRVQLQSSSLDVGSSLHGQSDRGAQGSRPGSYKSVRNDSVLRESSISDLSYERRLQRWRFKTDLFHGGTVDSKCDTESIIRSELRSSSLRSAGESMREGLGLSRCLSAGRGDRDGEVGVLP